jgi:hypothetical protein
MTKAQLIHNHISLDRLKTSHLGSPKLPLPNENTMAAARPTIFHASLQRIGTKRIYRPSRWPHDDAIAQFHLLVRF